MKKILRINVLCLMLIALNSYTMDDNQLGDQYMEQENYIKALEHYIKAFDENTADVNTLYNLGYLYYTGFEVTEDLNKAIKFYTLAAKQNSLDAIYDLGLIYLAGGDEVQDINKALKLFAIVAKSDSEKKYAALYELGIIHYNQKQYDHAYRNFFLVTQCSDEVAQEDSEVQEFIERAMQALGSMFFDGTALDEPNYIEATLWYSKAYQIHQSDVNADLIDKAWHAYLQLYHEKHSNRDFESALQWLQKALNAGVELAMVDLGKLYIKRYEDIEESNEKDFYTGLEWLNKAYNVESGQVKNAALEARREISKVL